MERSRCQMKKSFKFELSSSLIKNKSEMHIEGKNKILNKKKILAIYILFCITHNSLENN